MDVKLSIGEEEVGMDASILDLVQKDKGGASLNMLDDEMDSMKEEKTARTAEQQDPAEVYAAARKLADVIEGANVEDIISTIETLANQTHSSAIFNFRGLSRGSLLHIAAAIGKSNILRLLLDYVDAHLIAAQDDWGNTPLHIATKAEAFGVASMLVRRARDLSNVENILRIKNNHGNTALHEAVLTCDVEMVCFLVREDLELVYLKNEEQKSPLYLALDNHDGKLHEALFSLSLEPSRIQGMPPVHGAVVRRSYGLLAKILETNMKLFAMTDSKGGNIFHFAAHTNWAEVFELLGPKTEYLVQKQDMSGDLPIHIASKMGYVKLIKKLLPVSHLLNRRGQTVLHIAAKYGQTTIVSYILRHPELGMLINARDRDGNTPLHLAAMHLQPAALIILVLDQRIKPTLLNHECLTARNIAQDQIRRTIIRGNGTIREALGYMALHSSSAITTDLLVLRPEARDKEFFIVQSRKEMPKFDHIKDAINNRILVATLVATVTFAAGFAVPGGFNSSDTAPNYDQGMATMLHKRMFQAFVICNSIAMFSSMSMVILLMYTQESDIIMAAITFNRSLVLLTIALPAMSVAFLTGVTLTVGKLPGLANTIFYLGLLFLLIILIATLLQYPIYFYAHRPSLHRLQCWLVLGYIYFWRVPTYLLDDSEEDGMASGTSPRRPPDDAGESKTDDSVRAKCGDSPHPPNN